MNQTIHFGEEKTLGTGINNIEPYNPNISIPIVIDDTSSGKTVKMSRCTYFSIRCDTPSTNWALRLGDHSIPFLMLGLSGVVYRPSPREELFDKPSKLEHLFNSIETQPDLYVDINDLWIPNMLFGANDQRRGHIYRIGKDLFIAAYRFTNNDIQNIEYLDICKKLSASARYSQLETIALKDWGLMHINEARNIYYFLPEKTLGRRH
jgi:hypothetical protein